MELLKNTYVINLESRKDRLQHAINEFNKLNVIPIRFNAIKTGTGAIGCTLSHIKCLEIAIEEGLENIFICEDDITFLNSELFLNNLNKFNKKIKDWDVLIIGGNVVKPYREIDNCCLRIVNCQTTTGYIVNKQYYKVLLQNFRDGVKQLIQNPNLIKKYAIDIYWKNLQVKDKWYMIYPLTVTQYENYSDIEEGITNYNHLMLDAEKKWLFMQKIV